MAAVLAGFGAAAAQAQTGEPNYWQVNLGSGLGGHAHLSASAPSIGSASGDVDVKPGFFGSMAVGHSFGNGLAVEGEGYYAHNAGDTDSFGFGTSVDSYGVLANLMYAIAPVGPVVPYVGAGLGVGHSEFNAFGGGVGATGLVWQLRAGLSGDVTPTVKWDLGYRYFSEPRFDETATIDGVTGHAEIAPRIHVLTIGLRQRF
jgi:opacity protein-like surface antigen